MTTLCITPRVHVQESLGYVAEAGLFYSGSFAQLGSQMIGTIAVLGWTVVTSGLVFLALSKSGTLRISEESEKMGVDAAQNEPSKTRCPGWGIFNHHG